MFYFLLFFLILTNIWHLNIKHFAGGIKRPESQSSHFSQDHMKCFSETLMTLFSFVTKIISQWTCKSCGTGELEGNVGSLYRWKVAWADTKEHLCVHVNGIRFLPQVIRIISLTDKSKQLLLWRGVKLLDRGYEGNPAEKQQLRVITFQETVWNAGEGSAPFLGNAYLKKPPKTPPVCVNQTQQPAFVRLDCGDEGWDL